MELGSVVATAVNAGPMEIVNTFLRSTGLEHTSVIQPALSTLPRRQFFPGITN